MHNRPEKKTAGAFREIDGVHWSISGDWCTVNADGSIDLLGRGSVCIHTAGEKVHPEEVEETLKLRPAVVDATVGGHPDEKWGGGHPPQTVPRRDTLDRSGRTSGLDSGVSGPGDLAVPAALSGGVR